MSIILDKVDYVYSGGTAYEKRALNQVSLKIQDGEFIGIIGHTGSGKSTLIQHLNGLLLASSGGIYYNGRDIYEEDYDRKEWDCRRNTGTVLPLNCPVGRNGGRPSPESLP